MKPFLLYLRYTAPSYLAAQDTKMSLRAFTSRLLHNGRFLFGCHIRNNFRLSVLENVKAPVLRQGASASNSTQAFTFVRNVRKLFIDNVLNRLTNSFAADVRRKAAKRLLFGDSRPFLALVGVGLASGSGIVTREDELEGVCWEIREAVSRMEWSFGEEEKELQETHDSEEPLTIGHFELGPRIGKGCNAAVYAARLRHEEPREYLSVPEADHQRDSDSDTDGERDSFPFAIKIMFNYYAESNSMAILRAMYREGVPVLWDDVSAEMLSCWQADAAARRQNLSAHPNIVKMYCSFTDYMPFLPDSLSVYPDALPERLNPHGGGRNMSLFLVMKRYDTSLKEYLSKIKPTPQIATMLLAQLLEAVVHMNNQGIAHRDLKADNILLDMSEGDDVCPSLVVTDFGCCLADRDCGLNMPYTTYEVDRGGNAALMAPEVACAKPGLFTCINYSKADVWAVGTIAYELFGTVNPFYVEGNRSRLMTTSYQDEDLPPLPEQTPPVIAQLIKEMLSRNPSQRVSAELAATICQLVLWAPSTWLNQKESVKAVSSVEILQWLLSLLTKVLCESARWVRDDSPAESPSGSSSPLPGSRRQEEINLRRTLPEYHLVSSLLQRASLTIVRAGLHWIQNVC